MKLKNVKEKLGACRESLLSEIERKNIFFYTSTLLKISNSQANYIFSKIKRNTIKNILLTDFLIEKIKGKFLLTNLKRNDLYSDLLYKENKSSLDKHYNSGPPYKWAWRSLEKSLKDAAKKSLDSNKHIFVFKRKNLSSGDGPVDWFWDHSFEKEDATNPNLNQGDIVYLVDGFAVYQYDMVKK